MKNIPSFWPVSYLAFVFLAMIPANWLIKKSHSYFIDSKGKIVYCAGGSWFGAGVLQMNADAKSFQVLEEDLAKDNDFVYYREKVQDLEVDIPSFQVKNNIIKDRFHVFYNFHGNIYPITGADPKTYELINNRKGWARDKRPLLLRWYYGVC